MEESTVEIMMFIKYIWQQKINMMANLPVYFRNSDNMPTYFRVLQQNRSSFLKRWLNGQIV